MLIKIEWEFWILVRKLWLFRRVGVVISSCDERLASHTIMLKVQILQDFGGMSCYYCRIIIPLVLPISSAFLFFICIAAKCQTLFSHSGRHVGAREGPLFGASVHRNLLWLFEAKHNQNNRLQAALYNARKGINLNDEWLFWKIITYPTAFYGQKQTPTRETKPCILPYAAQAKGERMRTSIHN